MFLAGDVGGTKTKFALLALKDDRITIMDEARYESKDLSSLEDAVCHYLQAKHLWQTQEIQGAWFCLAGPITGTVCRLTNLDLTVDLLSLQKKLDFIPLVGWCNDLVALGAGIPLLTGDSLLPLNDRAGSDPDKAEPELKNKNSCLTRAVLAPGTGLGESLLIGDEAYPTEGAHADFAPQKEEDLELWRFLHRQYGHVSYEQVLSGPGLVNIYRFLVNLRPFPGFYVQTLSPEEVSKRALERTCPLSVLALDTFIRLLGAEAGNLALKYLALGGVYLGGGILPKIKNKLAEGTFISSFTAKGRFSELLSQIPVYVILEENTPLLGATYLILKKLGKADRKILYQTGQS